MSVEKRLKGLEDERKAFKAVDLGEKKGECFVLLQICFLDCLFVCLNE